MEGLESVIKNIEAYSIELGTAVDEELSTGAINIAERARADAPIGKTGALGNYVKASTGEKYNKTVDVFAPYAAYVEFGTGSRVFESILGANKGFQFSDDMKEFAMEFYVSGKGRMPASPFLVPAFEIEKVNIIKNIRSILLKNVRV